MATATCTLRPEESSPGPSGTGEGSWASPSRETLPLKGKSAQSPESFEMEGNSGSYLELDPKVSKRRNCFGLWLNTSGKDDDGAHKISGPFALFSVLILISVGVLTVKHLDARLPNALQIKDMTKHPNSFIEERARSDLHHLTSVGVRVSGSHVTDSVTVNMILEILEDIKSHGLSPETSLECEEQRPTGAFFRGSDDGHTSSYSKIANVVAKLEPKAPSRKTNDSILVNCHIDTKPGSPGATDNMISCSVMLEVIRVLAGEEKTPLKNSLVFLFNGAEELGLQGAHGFVKGYNGTLGNAEGNEVGHRWAKNLRTFINLEGAGGGGREILFQTGPGNSWTLEAYASSAPHPYGVAIAEEAFQLGLIPSDTDFRIFRDYGDLAGLDMAFIKNGWVYHTKWDKVSEIPPGSIQHMGENALAIVRHFSSKVDFTKIDFDSSGKMVYFDVLGLFMIYYPRWAGMIIDCLIGLGSIAAIIFSARSKAENGRNLLLALIWLPVSAVLSWVVGILAAILVALFFNACGYYKPFYSYPTLAIIIFGLPAVISQVILHSYTQNRSPVQTWMAQKLALAVILVVGTFVTRAVYIISINLLFSVITWHLTRYLCRGWSGSITLTYLIIGEFIPFVFSFYLLATLSDVFVPIMGRSGIQKENTVAELALHLFYWEYDARLWVHREDPISRKDSDLINIVDVDRTWYNADGQTVNRTEAGYWFWPYDSNMKDHFPILEKSVPELQSIQETKLDYNNCEDLYCAQPFTWPMVGSIKKTYWLPHSKSLPDTLKDEVSLTYTVSGTANDLQRRIDFSVAGPTQFTLVLSPGPSYELVNWTISDTLPNDSQRWKGRPTYFIFHSKDGGKHPITFSCIFKQNEQGGKSPLLTVQYSAFYLYGDELMTSEFRDMVDRLPGWTYTMPWTSVMKMYEIV